MKVGAGPAIHVKTLVQMCGSTRNDKSCSSGKLLHYIPFLFMVYYTMPFSNFYYLSIISIFGTHFISANCQRSSNCDQVPQRALTAEALIQTLNGNLLASRSATLTLEKWCGDHKLASKPIVMAKSIKVGSKIPPLPEIARVLLNVTGNDTVRYRKVELNCGDKVLSIADNWYVANRLNSDMNDQLNTTNIPFGKVIAPLRPFRVTYAVHFLWRPLPVGWEMQCQTNRTTVARSIPETILEHQAIVFIQDSLPVSFVDEHYTKDILDFL